MDILVASFLHQLPGGQWSGGRIKGGQILWVRDIWVEVEVVYGYPGSQADKENI